MPQLSEIEEFKASLRTLGDEETTLERWGESMVDDPLPEQGMPDDLASLMTDSLDAVASSGAGLDEPSPDELLDAGSDDLNNFLQDLRLEDEGGAEDQSSVPADTSDADLFSGLDTSDYSNESMSDLDSIMDQSADVEDAEIFDASALDSALDGLDLGNTDASNPVDIPDFSDLDEIAALDAPDSSFADSVEPVDSTETLDSSDSFGLPDDFADFNTPEAESIDELGDFEADADLMDTARADVPDSAVDDLGGLDLGDMDFNTAPDPADDSINALPDAEVPEELDDFDSFDLSGESASGSLPDLDALDLGGATFSPAGSADDLDNQLAALDEAIPETDNFSIDNAWGNDFHIPGFEMNDPKEAAKPAKPLITDTASAFAAKDAPVKAKPVELNEEQVDALQDTLLSYPLNVRLAIEDIIANDKGTLEQQQALIWMLVDGEAAKEAAKIASRIFKRTIQVPPGYEKLTGAALEAEKSTLSYIFRHSILPALQVILLVAAGLGALFFLGYNFAFRPLYAHYLYDQGYEQIEAGNYPQSWTYFEKADGYWIFKSWYYRYAEAYQENMQYDRTADLYYLILQRWAKEYDSALAWARMESEERYNFAEAERILNTHVLNTDYFNRSALLLMTHNYLNWADYEEQKYDGGNRAFITERYERARIQLAGLMEKYGQQDAYIELLMLYLIRLERTAGGNNLSVVLPLADYYLANMKRSNFSAASLAELSAYLVGHGQRDRVYDLIMAAWAKDEYLPELHVASAGWYRLTNMPERERGALENAVFSYKRVQEQNPVELTPRRLQNYVRSMIRLSELRKASAEYLDSEAILVQAISEYERAVKGRRFKAAAEFGKAYSHLADIYYEQHADYARALLEYEKAELNGYRTPATDYRRGYIYYDSYELGSRDHAKALELFYRAGLEELPGQYLLLATANTLYQRGDWFAAQAYYNLLIGQVQQKLTAISQPQPQEKASHGELVELMMIARNNMGASLYRISQRMGDPEKRSDAMYAFSESARLYDSLSRDQLSMVRSETKNMGYLNMDFVLHPGRGIDIAIYPEIPMDM
ncbi:MAG: hypothetical protein KKI09_16075 [Spirochaetes bacterium]|nr:hypothetical protein [Spirochaetota bacterium]MBU0956941.1 hypothetical protein [Spirochaetota bacterium]